MNYSTAVFLINDDVRAVYVTYEALDNAPRSLFKTLDKEIKVGDYVIVPTDTRHKMTVVKVVEVDSDAWMDYDGTLQWVIGRVDISDAAHVAGVESAAIERIKSAERLNKRKELREKLLADHTEITKALDFRSPEQSAAAITAE